MRPRRHPRRPSLRWVAAAIAVVAGALVVAGGAPSEASSTANLKITFTATERATGIQGIYVANGDGTGVRRITPGDGRQYNWAQWAFGGTKIVATVRAGAEGSPEDIVLMDPDGGNLRTVVAYRFRVGQPKVAGDGRSIVFTGTTPWFREIALYRLDLETLEATNLSAVTSPLGSLDADPKFAPDGRVIFASGADDHTDIATMATDGSDRRTITSDRYFNTDPEVSPDGASIAIASYRGDGNPGQPGRISTVGVKPDHWYLVVRDASTGAERVLTGGQSCIERLPDRACRPEETSAFKPVWTPDGRAIGYNGTLDRFHNCICVIGADGRNARVLLAPDGLALDWFDWTERAAAPSGAAAIGSKVRPSRVLVTSAGADGTVGLYSASPDLLHRTPLPLPPGMVPTEASWNAQHGRVVFTADAPVPAAGAPHPAPPPGERRRDHVTLDDLDPVRRHLRDAEASGDGAPAVDPRRQVFLREPGGAVRQLTDPWIEDWRDGLTEGDLRSNTDPVLSPDGRSVVVTNRSSVTGESFLLRISIDGGEVLNLTNGSAGALPVDDAGPAFSPDGTHLAFTWTYGSAAEVAVTDAAEGRTVTRLTDDDWYDTAPTWNADGQSVTYSSYRGEGSPVTDDGRPKPAGWVLVRRDLRGGPEQVLGTAGAPAWLPSASPEGDLVVAIGIGPSSAEILAVAPGSPSAGDRRGVAALAGAPAATLRWLQPTPFDNELFVDWR